MSVKISEAFPSPYLKCADLGGKPWDMKIRAVVMEDLGQGNDKEAKAVVYFESAKKGFVLNRTPAPNVAAGRPDHGLRPLGKITTKVTHDTGMKSLRHWLHQAGRAATDDEREAALEIGGPVFLKLNKRVHYTRRALFEWLAAGRRTSTSDTGRVA